MPTRTSVFRFLAIWIAFGAAVPSCRGGQAPRVTPDPATKRTTQSGDVVGMQARYDSHAWLGIPYAAPPVGPQRWRAPQPPVAWSGTREAVALGSPCTQYTSPFGGVAGKRANEPAGSEDCHDDPRLPTQRDRCQIFRSLAGWSRGFTEKEYANAGRRGCADYPFDKFPWS